MALGLTQRPAQAHLGDYIRVVTPDATASACGSLTDLMGGRVIPLNIQLRLKLTDLLEQERQHHRFDLVTSHMIRTERSEKTSPQAIVNMFASWFKDTGLNGCSSHSGRPKFITNAAKKISSAGGSLRDVQMLGWTPCRSSQRWAVCSD